MTLNDKNNLIKSIPCIAEIRFWGMKEFKMFFLNKIRKKYIITDSGNIYFKDIATVRNIEPVSIR